MALQKAEVLDAAQLDNWTALAEADAGAVLDLMAPWTSVTRRWTATLRT